MTKGNIFGTEGKKTLSLCLLPGCIKYQRQLNSLEPDTNRKGLDWEKTVSLYTLHFALALLQQLRCNGFDVMVFASSFCL